MLTAAPPAKCTVSSIKFVVHAVCITEINEACRRLIPTFFEMVNRTE